MNTENTELLENILGLPCPSCGGQFEYSAEKKKIACNHCGHTEAIDRANDLVQELSLHNALNEAPSFSPEKIGNKVFDCQNCGSKFMIDLETVKVICGFCGSENVNLEAYEHKFIKPSGIVPFIITKEVGREKFEKWIGQGFFAPFRLKRLAKQNPLRAIYIPFWTFDAQTETEYQGEAGHHYYESKRVYINGKWQTQQVRKTRWVWRSGQMSYFFDDVLIVAAKGVQQLLIDRIQPYLLDQLVNFDPRLLAGWEAEVYGIDLNIAYDKADGVMDSRILAMSKQKIGGDVQRNVGFTAEKFNQTFKHIILPIWLCSYEFKGKTYQFCINGQTGKIGGQKPVSWVKMVLLALVFFAFLGGLYFAKNYG